MIPFTSEEIARLRRAFGAVGGPTALGAACPEPSRIWDAAWRALAPAPTRELVEHTASCAACAEAWRLARELPAEATPAAAPMRRQASPSWTMVAAVAAALVMIGALVVTQLRRSVSPETPVVRGSDANVLRSLVPENEALAREGFLLRWSPGPEGASYSVEVAREDLTPVSRARGLGQTQYQVPASALTDLTSGAKVFWRVEALLPDGSRIASPTFASRVK